MLSTELESTRLAFFLEHGFEGRSRTFPDRDRGNTYAIVRQQAGVPLLLIHGGLADAGVWYPLAGKLPGTIVIPDRPGCGLSYPIDYRGVDYRREAAEWLLSLVDGLGADQVDLVGNSMGGYFSAAFATAHPRRVRKLVLVGAPAGLDRRLPTFLKLLGRPLIGRLLQSIDMSDPEVVRKRIFADLLADAQRIPRAAIEYGIAMSSTPKAKLCARTMLANVSDWGGWREKLLMRDALAALDVPTLFVWGDKDTFAPPSSGEELAARMPNARIAIVPDAGHLIHIDAPDAVARHIIDFVSEPKTIAASSLAQS